jgi:hypothetical protein
MCRRKRQLRIFLIAVLFPYWGIGGLQLLAGSLVNLPGLLTAPAPAKTIFDEVIFLLLSSLAFFSGMYYLVDTVWRYFQDQLSVWQVNREIEEKLKLASAGSYDDADGQFSYTKVWYMSFQNHLAAQSGFDTLQLKPLKRWPAMLKQHFPEDLLPVWLIPLLLMALLAVPLVALLVAAGNVLLFAVTGLWFCEYCLNGATCMSRLIADLIWTFPLLCAAALAAWFLAGPLCKAMLAAKKSAS